MTSKKKSLKDVEDMVKVKTFFDVSGDVPPMGKKDLELMTNNALSVASVYADKPEIEKAIGRGNRKGIEEYRKRNTRR